MPQNPNDGRPVSPAALERQLPAIDLEARTKLADLTIAYAKLLERVVALEKAAGVKPPDDDGEIPKTVREFLKPRGVAPA